MDRLDCLQLTEPLFPMLKSVLSCQHAKLEVVDTKALSLSDLDSVHGTFVNSRRLQKGVTHKLRLGDTIRFGASTRSYLVRNTSDDST